MVVGSLEGAADGLAEYGAQSFGRAGLVRVLGDGLKAAAAASAAPGARVADGAGAGEVEGNWEGLRDGLGMGLVVRVLEGVAAKFNGLSPLVPEATALLTAALEVT